MENKSYFRYFVLKTLFQALYLEIKLLKYTQAYKAKTLKSKLVKAVDGYLGNSEFK
jgi:hypothetical protein